MAFFLLAASARDDTFLLFKHHCRHRHHPSSSSSGNQHDGSSSTKKRQRRPRKKMLSALFEFEEKEESEHDEASVDSFNSLPSDWKGPEQSVVNSNSNQDDKHRHHKNHHHHHHPKFLPLRSLSSSTFWKLQGRRLTQLPARASTVHPTAPSFRSSGAAIHKWRERRRIKAVAPRIQAQVERRVQASAFLSSTSTGSSSISTTPSNDDVVVIGRNQLSLQYWLGGGGFCEVWQVDSSSLPSTTVFGAAGKKKPNVVLKHIKSSLLHDHSRDHHHHHYRNHHLLQLHHNKNEKPDNAFVLGATDLAMEGLYLSRLRHPHIIRLYGVVQPSPTDLPYSDGRPDGFGLLLETLSDTLDQRLEEWKRLALYDDEDDDSCSLVLAAESNNSSSNNNHHTNNRSSAAPSPGWLFRAAQSNTTGTNNINMMSKTHTSRVVHYALQLADALQHLHKHRIVMCDAKPQNIGFTKEHTVKLFDFGLCQNLPARRSSSSNGNDNGNGNGSVPVDGDEEEDRRLYTLPVAGTPLYLPKEVLMERKYNCFTDVYSWAIVFWEMISLATPFEEYNNDDDDDKKNHDYTQKALYEHVAKRGARPTLQGVIPLAFHSLLQHAWDANVQTRWTMQHVHLELQRIKEQLGVDTPVATSRRHSRHLRRKSSKLQYLDLVEASNSQMDDTSENYDGDEEDDIGSYKHSSMTADDFELMFAASRGS